MSNETSSAYEELRRRILSGRYESGTQLKEEALAREFGVSRTPIRAALKRLVGDKLATPEGGWGIRVADWTADDVDEAFQIRVLLEPYAARRAVERGGPELAARLKHWNQRMAEGIARGGAAGMAKVQEANQGFHRAILDACGPGRIRTAILAAADNPILIRGFYLYSAEELRQSLHHHQDLALAAEVGDASLAGEVMQLHIKMAHQRFTRRRATAHDADPPG